MNLILGLLAATYFALTPQTALANTLPSTLVCIVSNESDFRQFTANGSPLISPTNDVGIMQINETTWLPLSKKMGLDIVNNAQDNVTFGVYLYNKYGPTIWTTYKRFCAGNSPNSNG